jgi:hypothetical protein
MCHCGLFRSSSEGFRAGLAEGKLLKRMVSAEGIESALKRIFNDMQVSG